MAKKPRKPTAVEKKLIGVADLVIAAAEKRKDPTIAIPVRSLSNVNFNERKGLIEMGKRKQARSFFNVAMAKKFMQTVLVADALSELQRANLTTSLREIYYRTKHTIKDSHENTLDTQDESDPIIEDLEVTLTALREELHVRAENAGSIVGPVVFVDDGDRVDCTRLGKGGYSVPSIVEPEYLQIARCTADFVLLVEKGTQWNRLSEDKFWRRYNCVLLTGNGQPPAASGAWRDGCTRRRSSPSMSWWTTTRGATTSTRSSSRARSISPSRASAWPSRRRSSWGCRARIPKRTGSRATWASSSTTRTSPAPASCSATRGSRRRAGRRRSSGCSRAGSNTSWTPSPTRTSSTSPRSTFLASSKRRTGWTRRESGASVTAGAPYVRPRAVRRLGVGARRSTSTTVLRTAAGYPKPFVLASAMGPCEKPRPASSRARAPRQCSPRAAPTGSIGRWPSYGLRRLRGRGALRRHGRTATPSGPL